MSDNVEAAIETEESTEETVADGLVEETTDELDASDEANNEGPDEDSEDSDDDAEGRPSRSQRLVEEGDIAADYLYELLDIVDLDGEADLGVEGDRATVSIDADLRQLVGEHGEVLEALQELTRLAVYRETGERSRLMLDIAGYRAGRRTALEAEAGALVAQVKETGESVSLDPMSPFERKIVHDVVAAAGLKSESEGVEPRRFVVILPA